MKLYHPILWLIVTICLVQGLPAESRISNAEISKANNAFALDLYARLAKEPGTDLSRV
jgi:serine protease inhibitor